MDIRFKPLGILHTCYKEKFGIPRQPNLVTRAPARLVLYPEFAREEAIRGLEGFSHVWLLFLFHGTLKRSGPVPPAGPVPLPGTDRPPKAPGSGLDWSPMVRPPRLGGNQKVGVFASRSPFRPNPIGMSAVRLESVEATNLGPVLHLSGVDILDQTPVLDIKPYLPYADVIPDAKDGFAHGPPDRRLTVEFSDQALDRIREKESKIPDLRAIITQVLENDPRPAYQAAGKKQAGNAGVSSRVFGIRLFDFDLKWQVTGERIQVLGIEETDP